MAMDRPQDRISSQECRPRMPKTGIAALLGSGVTWESKEEMVGMQAQTLNQQATNLGEGMIHALASSI